MRPSYSTFVVSIIRLYFTEEIDKTTENYKAVEKTLSTLSDLDVEIIKFVYSDMRFMEQVETASIKFDVNENYVWKLCKTTEKRVAINRGLI